MNYIKTIFISGLVSLVVGVTMFNVPTKWFNYDYWFPSQKLGTAFTTLQSTDVLSNFPTTYNANIALTPNTSVANTYTSLNQFANASTSLLSCYGPCYFGGSATSSFSSAGALTLITPLTTANGGTGSTTLSFGQVLLGSTTNAIGTVQGYGTSGQFLTSNGVGIAPSWSTSAIDQSIAYAWTGNHSFIASTTVKNFTASSTLANPIYFNGLAYDFKSTRSASSTSLQEDGNGHLLFDRTDYQQIAEQVITSANATSTVTWTGSARDLKIVFDAPSVTNTCLPELTFNTDYAGTGINYGYRFFTDYTLVVASGGNRMIILGNQATTSPIYSVIEINNNTTVLKNGHFNTDYGVKGTNMEMGTIHWNNTSAQITSVNIRVNNVAACQWGSGTRLTVYGKRN